jgi:hypothetical protein
MNDLISVEGHPNLFRDSKTGAIINCDSISYKQYLNGVSNRMTTKLEIENLKNEVSEIKSLLKEILNETRMHQI